MIDSLVIERGTDINIDTLTNHYLWRLCHNTEAGYSIELYAGGELGLLLDGERILLSKSAKEIVAKMEELTVPAYVTVRMTSGAAQAVVNRNIAVSNHIEELSAACSKALKEAGL